MDFRYEAGAEEDFSNMTKEMGKWVLVCPRSESLTYEGFEGDAHNIENNPMSAKSQVPRKEKVFLQELESENEVVAAGVFKVGDVKMNFLPDSLAEEEGYVVDGKKVYKIMQLTRYGAKVITDIRAFGKKLPNR